MANCHNKAIIIGGKHPNDLTQFRYQHPAGQPQDQLQRYLPRLQLDKYARRYLGGYCFRFNRRFSMAGMTARIANAVCCCMPLTERDLRGAEAYG